MAKKKTTTTERYECFQCTEPKPQSEYYESRSIIYIGFKRLPVCKKCVNDLYIHYLDKYQDKKQAMYNLCEKLDMPFHQSIFDKASEKEGIETSKHYFRVLNSFRDKNGYADDFDGGEHPVFNDASLINIQSNSGEIGLETQIFWGFGFDFKDYMFLESEITTWKKTHKCDNQAELTLLKEICIKILQIRKKREKNEDVSKDLKDLQDLMKTASVDPAKSNAINSGDNVDRFGVWLKDIEQLKPAEWWENQEKYKDMDGFLPYIKNYIVRPIKNFFTGSKDFLINGEDLSFTEKEDDENE